MFGERLASLRKLNKITQVDLAKKLGIPRSTYSNYEAGKRQADYETLQKIAEYFEVTTDYLLGRTDDYKSTASNKPNFDSLSEINKILTDLGVTDFFMHNIDDWKNLTPVQVEELRKDFESFLEYKAFEAKKMRSNSDDDSSNKKS
ncbi:helix-turn-helix domain-containing protein [Bacillus sp. es.036]|uniref:helix-turn-helix domain-containing protein n=1 Tax=Bacillus sp. es.036 TaxID=1761764 RepID=UPI000BF9FA14|nr:helix-turn-helix transcriptional regulator [Bacillus sp. es.036]PFG13040.1 transcriptional regulator with XRE-family HTH domain [Bacillus sp. es.036]